MLPATGELAHVSLALYSIIVAIHGKLCISELDAVLTRKYWYWTVDVFSCRGELIL